MLTVLMAAVAMMTVEPTCIDDRQALLALSQQAFDQDLNGGWRAVARRQGCKPAAADLIAEYRAMHDLEDEIILTWHEGQLRADIGQTEMAIALFRRSYEADDPDTVYDDAWNFYADATIAFVERDRDGLIEARDKLLALPKPEGHDEMADRTEAQFGFRPLWPQNINVVESLIRCFEKPYVEAYMPSCGIDPQAG